MYLLPLAIQFHFVKDDDENTEETTHCKWDCDDDSGPYIYVHDLIFQ